MDTEQLVSTSTVEYTHIHTYTTRSCHGNRSLCTTGLFADLQGVHGSCGAAERGRGGRAGQVEGVPTEVQVVGREGEESAKWHPNLVRTGEEG